MEEIRNEEIEQISGGTYKEQRDLQDFLDRVSRDRVPFPAPVPNPFW
jgi:hypothetical protein